MKISARQFLWGAIVSFSLAFCAAASAQDAPGTESAVGDATATGKGWQTFESCPFGERPCGPICMPASFSCCDKATASICPPGQTCCGIRCGCERCQSCVDGACVTDEECLKKQGNSTASSTSAAQGAGLVSEGASLVVPGVLLGIGVAGALAPTGSESRRPISP